MAQHDYNLSNATGANFRADLNNMATAIVTVNSGTGEPAVRFPGMLWLDLSGGGDGIIRRRNQANNGWLTDIGIDQTARNSAAAAQTTANAALPRTGGTMTGAIVLPVGEPTNNQAVSRAAADTLYQVKLPIPQAGSLLTGAAGGWQSTLAPGVDQAVLVVSGGLPQWQSTGVIASPGVVVRTGADGTIDSSFIPQVASGLRFCGTFRPAVNFEYPTTGGHGAGGVPAIGDFWVIDGLTTGGYTYLTGSLAGVTVYNGDSIAYNGASAWFRMGSTVNLQGYLKTDGSIAMAGALNMGGFAINNVNGIAGRAGAKVPLTNFKIDATNTVVAPQRGSTGSDLPGLDAGQLATDLGRMQIVVGNGTTNTNMLPVRFFSASAAYAAGDYVWNGGRLYRAPVAIAAGAFTASQWRSVLDSDGGTVASLGSVGTITAPIFTATSGAANTGQTRVVNGDAQYPGYIGFYGPDGSRWGIVGYGAGGNLQVLAETGHGWQFDTYTTFNNTVDFMTNQRTKGFSQVGGLTGGEGFVQNIAGDNIYPGYISFNGPDAQRWGTIGYGFGTEILMQGVNGHYFRITDRLTLRGELRNYPASGGATQQMLQRYGFSNEVQRIGMVIEADSSFGFYAYDANGANPIPFFQVNHNYSAAASPIVNLRGSLSPMVDNAYYCGLASTRYAVVYAANGTIQTSDEREKTPFEPLSDAEIDVGQAFLEVMGRYRWTDNANDELFHFGAGAQTIIGKMEAAGLYPDQYGIVRHDMWPGTPERTGPDGEVVTPAVPAGDRYSMQYNEATVLALAALDRRLRILEATNGGSDDE